MRRRPKPKVLFLCTGNSCRSQMAEGWARHLLGEQVLAYSTGIEKRGLDPRAVAAMREVGVDISAQSSKRVDELDAVDFDLVITVCDHARATCPSLPGRPRQTHVAFDDPPKLAASAENEEQALAHYRRVRDEIRELVRRLPEMLA